MLILAIIIFALAAMLGMYLLTFILQNKNTPKGVTFTHGPLAVCGVLILIIYSLIYSHKPIISLSIFILAAFGGLILIHQDLTERSIPKWLALGHGLAAIIGLIALVIFTFV